MESEDFFTIVLKCIKQVVSCVLSIFVCIFTFEFVHHMIFGVFQLPQTNVFLAEFHGLKLIAFVVIITLLIILVYDVNPLPWVMLALVLAVLVVGIIDGYYYALYDNPKTSLFPTLNRNFGGAFACVGALILFRLVVSIFSYKKGKKEEKKKTKEEEKVAQPAPQQQTTPAPTYTAPSGGSESMGNTDGGDGSDGGG